MTLAFDFHPKAGAEFVAESIGTTVVTPASSRTASSTSWKTIS